MVNLNNDNDDDDYDEEMVMLGRKMVLMGIGRVWLFDANKMTPF